MLLPIRDQCEDNLSKLLQIDFFEFVYKVLIQIFYTFIINIVCCCTCEDYHIILSYLQFEVLNWHFDKLPNEPFVFCTHRSFISL